MTDIRDVKRRVPMSEDMLYSRWLAGALLVAVPLILWALYELGSWFYYEIIW